MKHLFDPDGAVMRGLTALSDIILLNLCFLLCCIPLVTAGAAWSALYGAYLRRREGDGAVRLFFSGFRRSFRQATVIWLLLAGAGVVLALDFRLIAALESVPAIVTVLLYLGALLVAGTGLYVFPMIAVYEDTTLRMLKNALILSITALPRTLLLGLLAALPLIVLLLDVELFGRLLMLWLLVGCSVTAKAGACILKGVFQRLVNTGRPQ